jgi:hypothetical protein
MKSRSKAIVAIVLVILVAGVGYGAFAYYSIFIESNGGNSCIPYLRTDCGGNHNAITYNTSNGDITVPSVSQSYGSTYYNVAVAYVPGNPNFEPTAAYFTSDSADFPGNMLASGQSVTVHNLNATGPTTAGQMYNGSLWIAYTSASGGQGCTGAYDTASGCQYTQIGTITLKG